MYLSLTEKPYRVISRLDLYIYCEFWSFILLYTKFKKTESILNVLYNLNITTTCILQFHDAIKFPLFWPQASLLWEGTQQSLENVQWGQIILFYIQLIPEFWMILFFFLEGGIFLGYTQGQGSSLCRTEHTHS